MIDGRRQRNALTAAEQALLALRAGGAAGAREAASRAAELDQVDVFGTLVDAVASAADEIEATGTVSGAAWRALSEAVGPGPLRAIVEEASGDVPPA